MVRNNLYRNKAIIVLLLMFFPILNVLSQVKEEWVARYDGPVNGWDVALAIAVDSSRNVYVTGYSDGTYYDYATIKYNSAGVQQWVTRYNGYRNGSDYARAMAIDSSGNVYVTGESAGLAYPYYKCDYLTIKYDTAGVEQWIDRYNGGADEGYDFARAIAIDSSGNVYVTGQSWCIVADISNYNYATVKYNNAGVEQWVKRYDGPGNDLDNARAIAIDSSGNVYVTGESWGLLAYNRDYATIKYSSSGVQQWVKRYNGPKSGPDMATAIAVDSSGNVYVTGTSTGLGTERDYATIKYDSAGVQQWVARYNGPGNDLDDAYAIAMDSSGNVYVTGRSIGSGTSSDYATIKYNSSGVQQWVARYNGPGNSNDWSNAIAIDSSGNLYVTGESLGSGTNYDYATIKYNSLGIQQWIARFNGPENSTDGASAIAVDSSGNIYVTGYSDGFGTNYDYVTIKYSQVSQESFLTWSTFLGGGDVDKCFSVDNDVSGNVYVTGYTASNNFPTTVGAFDSIYNTPCDGFISKFDVSGGLLWSTFIGGTGSVEGGMVTKVDSEKNVYIVGVTNSADFPITSGAFDTTANGARDIFISKFNETGQMIWSTFFGGSSDEWCYDADIDSMNNIVLTGYTKSTNFPTTDGAYCKDYIGGEYDAFITKFNKNGSLIWSTYVGGTDWDKSFGIDLDSSDNIYITGYTESIDFPTQGDYVQSFKGGSDIFITCFNSSGSLIWSTFFGGSGNDYGYDIGVYGNNDLYITGGTWSDDFPTNNGYDTSYNGGCDVFVSHFKQNGELLWSTYLGGSGDDCGYINPLVIGSSLAFDVSGNVYIAGDTTSTNFPTTEKYDSTYNGGRDVFLTKLSSGGSLIWSTYFGGTADDAGWPEKVDITSDYNGYFWISGWTKSGDFPVFNGYDMTHNWGGWDGFVSKFREGYTETFENWLFYE